MRTRGSQTGQTLGSSSEMQGLGLISTKGKWKRPTDTNRKCKARAKVRDAVAISDLMRNRDISVQDTPSYILHTRFITTAIP